MKTSELTGIQLDWAVAKCEGGEGLWYDTVATYWVKLNGSDRALSKGWAQSFTPSTDWAQAGVIIEREGIMIERWASTGHWQAANALVTKVFTAETPLVAAMRCYVASKLGDEVEVPKELK